MSLFLKKMQSELQMAIAPIDLQTLYTQLDKIGKTQGSQAHNMQVQSVLQDAEKAKQQLEEHKKISSTTMPDEKIKDRQHNQDDENKNSGHEKESQEENLEKKQKVPFQDPDLGQHIDVIG
mgnify:CR=1 FL=1